MPLSSDVEEDSPAVLKCCEQIENALSSSPAFRKVDDRLFVVKQGSTVVMISVHPWKETHAVVRLVSQLVKGVTMETPLALELLKLNATLRFGAFAYAPVGDVILLCHTLVDREISDKDEFVQTMRDFVLVADDYDDRIADRYGGQTMQDLIEDGVIDHLRSSHLTDTFLRGKS